MTTERRRYQRWPNYALKYRAMTADAAPQIQELAEKARELNAEVLRLQQLNWPDREDMGRRIDGALADIGRLAALIEVWMLRAEQGQEDL